MSIVSGIDILFATGNQSTGLVMHRKGDGEYDATFSYRRSEAWGFPRRELICRQGILSSAEADDLFMRLHAICENWHHHYLCSSETGIYKPAGGQWRLRIDYEDGQTYRCDGVDEAPYGIDDAYRLLIDHGMVALKLDCDHYLDLFGPRRLRDRFDGIVPYGTLLEQALALQDEHEATAQIKMLLSEFVREINRYLPEGYVTTADTPEGEGDDAVKSVEELLTTEVSSASRFEMLSLIESLSRAPDLSDAVRRVLDSGTFARWCARIEEIPSDESRAYYDRLDRENRLLAEHINRALEKRIAAKEEFTSYEVARELGTTAQKVSVRVRRLVREGQLEAIADSMPRRYRVACLSEEPVPA